MKIGLHARNHPLRWRMVALHHHTFTCGWLRRRCSALYRSRPTLHCRCRLCMARRRSDSDGPPACLRTARALAGCLRARTTPASSCADCVLLHPLLVRSACVVCACVLMRRLRTHVAPACSEQHLERLAHRRLCNPLPATAERTAPAAADSLRKWGHGAPR